MPWSLELLSTWSTLTGQTLASFKIIIKTTRLTRPATINQLAITMLGTLTENGRISATKHWTSNGLMKGMPLLSMHSTRLNSTRYLLLKDVTMSFLNLTLVFLVWASWRYIAKGLLWRKVSQVLELRWYGFSYWPWAYCKWNKHWWIDLINNQDICI